MADSIQTDGVQQRERTIAESIFDEGRAEGRIEGERETLIRLIKRLGASRFGHPTFESEWTLSSIKNVESLRSIGERVLDADSWASLLTGT